MESVLEKTTQISVGTSTHRDIFQRGREAAQMAKTQHANSAIDLVLALSDTGVHFKDFIEGVRLVLGEKSLIGLPCEPWLAQDAPSQETGAVIIVGSKTHGLFVAHHRTTDDRMEVSTTHLASAAQKQQANGLLLFGENHVIANATFQRAMVADMSPGAWIVGAAWNFKSNNLLACQSEFFNHGIAAIGVNSMRPWQIASVNLGSFRKQPQFVEQGLKTAVRSALQQKPAATIAFGFVFLNGFEDLNSSEAHRSISNAMSVACPHIPWLGLATESHMAHHDDRWQLTAAETLTIVLVPA